MCSNSKSYRVLRHHSQYFTSGSIYLLVYLCFLSSFFISHYHICFPLSSSKKIESKKKVTGKTKKKEATEERKGKKEESSSCRRKITERNEKKRKETRRRDCILLGKFVFFIFLVQNCLFSIILVDTRF